MLVGPVLDVVLDLEPVLNAEARRDLGEDAHHEGELTAAYHLIDRLHETYGTFIDAFVFDALYANGPVMTKIDAYGYGGFIVLKKNDNEPLKEALALWQDEEPCQQLDDDEKKEHVEFWDVDDVDTLDTYDGKVRVIRAVTTKASGTGIGLYMSKTIIEKHMDGNIVCRNTADGAEFTISVPLGTGDNTGEA